MYFIVFKSKLPNSPSGVTLVYDYTMSNELARQDDPVRRLQRRNTMAFPRELREAIPNIHAGRALELDSISGQSSNAPLFGPVVKLKFVVKETGKLTGQFVVLMDLQPDAARALADKLTKLADAADNSQPT
jgi:hypothetical protein